MRRARSEQPDPVTPWPALGAWGAVALGFFLASASAGDRAVPAWWWLVAALGAGVWAARARGRAALVALVMAATLLSGAFFTARIIEPVARGPGMGWPLARRALVSVEGVALENPEHGPANPGALSRFVDLPPVTRFTLGAERVRDATGWRTIHGLLYARVGEVVTGVRAGDRVRLDGFFKPIEPSMNPGQPDARRFAAQRGVIGRILASSRANVVRLEPASGAWARGRSTLLRLRADIRSRVRGWLDASIARQRAADDPAPGLLEALLLGDREDPALRDLSASMRRIGAAHLLSISGLHLGVLVWLAVVALRAIGVRAGIETALVALFVLLYLVVTPVRTPIVRAAVMALGFLAAEFVGRRYHPLAALAWVGVAVLLWRPMDLWSPGYQLSFGIVAAIVTLPRIVVRRWRPMTPEPDAMTGADRVRLGIERVLIFAVCAWAVSAPIVALHFGVFSTLGAIASVALFPLVVAALLVGVVTILLGAMLPTLALVTGATLTIISRLIAHLAYAMDALPGSAVRLPPVSVWWAIAAEGVVIWWLVRGSWRSRRDLALAALVLVWLGGFAVMGRLGPRVALRIDTIAVDDGSCHLIRSGGDGVLWDAGSRLLWLGERELPRALRAVGAWRVRTIVLSHPNFDHYSAIPDLIAPLGARELLVGAATIDAAREDPSGPVAWMLNQARRRGVRVRAVSAGDTITIGDATLRFLHPARGARWPSDNDASLVAQVAVPTLGGVRSALLCGDIEDAAIAAITRARPGLHADVMEAPHHGSAHRAAIRFIERVNPSVVVQSTGLSRAGDDRLAHLRESRRWFTTATDGAVRIEIRRDGSVRASSHRRPSGSVSAGGSASAGSAQDQEEPQAHREEQRVHADPPDRVTRDRIEPPQRARERAQDGSLGAGPGRGAQGSREG